MLAVFKTGGKQYSVKAGQILKVEKLEGSKGDSISFKDVLAITDNVDHTIGSPLVKGAIVQAKILDQIRDKKIIVFKKRQRQNYRHTQGHRQYLTVLHIESIAIGDKKSLAPERKVSVVKNNESEKIISKKEALSTKTENVKEALSTKTENVKVPIKKKSIKKTVKKKTTKEQKK